MNNSYKNYIGMRLQNLSAARRIFRVFAIFSLSLVARPSLLSAQDQTSIPEEIEWTWEVRPQLADPKLPNVLLLGDSITRTYFPEVTKDLSGIANVYLLASSTSVGDPRLPHQIAEFASLQGVSFAVVHFNNGLHGWGYTKAQFKSGFPIFLQAIRALPGRGKLIWTTITPIKPEASNGATNPRIDARNARPTTSLTSEKGSVPFHRPVDQAGRHASRPSGRASSSPCVRPGDRAGALSPAWRHLRCAVPRLSACAHPSACTQ